MAYPTARYVEEERRRRWARAAATHWAGRTGVAARRGSSLAYRDSWYATLLAPGAARHCAQRGRGGCWGAL